MILITAAAEWTTKFSNVLKFNGTAASAAVPFLSLKTRVSRAPAHSGFVALLFLWNVATRGQVVSFEIGISATQVQFSPDGRTLAVLCGPALSSVRELRVYRAPSLEQIKLSARAAVDGEIAP